MLNWEVDDLEDSMETTIQESPNNVNVISTPPCSRSSNTIKEKETGRDTNAENLKNVK